MAEIQCPGCGSTACSKLEVTEREKVSARQAGNAARHGGLIVPLVTLGVMGAKAAFSQAYRCRCGREFRAWFKD